MKCAELGKSRFVRDQVEGSLALDDSFRPSLNAANVNDECEHDAGARVAEILALVYPKDEAAVVAAVDHGIFVGGSVESAEAHSGAETNVDFDDDGNYCDSADFESADYCCSPKLSVATDLAFVASDDASSTGYRILCSIRFPG